MRQDQITGHSEFWDPIGNRCYFVPVKTPPIQNRPELHSQRSVMDKVRGRHAPPPDPNASPQGMMGPDGTMMGGAGGVPGGGLSGGGMIMW